MISYEAFRDYEIGLVKLMVWYVRELAFADSPVPISEALDLRVDILRKTTLYDGRHPAMGLDPPIPEWDGLKIRIEAGIRRSEGVTDAGGLEEACWEMLEPLVTPALPARHEESTKLLAGPYRCWRFGFLSRYHADPALTDCIDLHFANACCPESPFSVAHREDLLRSLHRMLTDARQAHPQARSVMCGSWLNRLPRFQALFPPAWTASFTPSEFSSGTAGHWGQYMNRTGAFHAHNASLLRATGKHPYPCGVSHCDVDDALRHAMELLGRLAS